MSETKGFYAYGIEEYIDCGHCHRTWENANKCGLKMFGETQIGFPLYEIKTVYGD